MLPYTAHDLIAAVNQELDRKEPVPGRQPGPSEPHPTLPRRIVSRLSRESWRRAVWPTPVV